MWRWGLYLLSLSLLLLFLGTRWGATVGWVRGLSMPRVSLGKWRVPVCIAIVSGLLTLVIKYLGVDAAGVPEVKARVVKHPTGGARIVAAPPTPRARVIRPP